MSKDFQTTALPAAITVTILSGLGLLIIAFGAPDPCPPLLQKTFEAFLQIFVVGGTYAVSLYNFVQHNR